MIFNKKLTDKERREFILHGDLWKVVLWISLPLAVYSSFNQFFGIFDTFMAAKLGAESVSAIAYINQLQIMVNSIGGALSIGGSIIVARYIGAGDIKAARKYVSTLFALSFILGMTILIGVVPFVESILRFSQTPEELIKVGKNYFIIEIIMIVVIFINSVYIAIEKAKGKTKSILFLNLAVLSVKSMLTLLFVYVFKFGVTMLAVASLVSHLVITIYGSRVIFNYDNDLRFRKKDVHLNLKTISPIISLSFPIFMEKFLFSFGKVVVNSMSASYGSTVVGALGISNRMGGMVTTPTNGFGDGEASIISQNLGNENIKRALEAFKKTLIINLIIGTVGFILMTIFMDSLIEFFAKDNPRFAVEIRSIYYYERIAAITLAITSSVMGMLYGFGYTKLALYLSMLRLFAFRIPSLYIMKNFTNLGSESVGIAMLISNGLVGVSAVIVAVIIVKKVKSQNLTVSPILRL